MFRMKVIRKAVLERDIDGNKITYHFKFPFVEDFDSKEFFSRYSKDELKGIKKDDEKQSAFFSYYLRKSLINVEGMEFELEDGSVVNFKDENGVINLDLQKAVMDEARSDEDFYAKILLAYKGELDSKNSKTGEGHVSSTDTTPVDVTPVI